MRLLVTGCGRSGTTWIAEAIRSTGVNCGHELAFTVGLDGNPERWGSGDWQAESSAFAAPYTPILNAHVVHLTRDPRAVVASMLARSPVPGLGTQPETRENALRWLPFLAEVDDPTERAALHWVWWNRMVVADERLRLEDVTAADVTRFARIVDPDAREAVLPPPQNVAKDRPGPVSWDGIRDVPGLMELATEYGYMVR